MKSKSQKYSIFVGGGYGAFFFDGDEKAAEEMRIHKARWEGAVAVKRLATADEIKNGKPSQDWKDYSK